MRLASVFVLSAFLLPLAACGSQPTVSATNASTAEVQEQLAAAGDGAVTLEPGRWEGSMTMHEMDIPGVPAAVREQMKAQAGAGRSFVNCVTPEDVKEQKALFTGENDDKSCTYDHFTLAGGRIDAALRCNRPEGRMTMTMAGNYSPQSYKMDLTSKAESTGAAGALSMKMSVEARRVGACKGTPDEL